jgi:sterol desaturase/sphingolipid hydroxylase (fatty acid hydroxylase superfamily)
MTRVGGRFPMRRLFSRLSRVNWTHLALLSGLPVWIGLTEGVDVRSTIAAWLAINLSVLLIAERLMPYRPCWQADGPALKRDVPASVTTVVVDAALSAVVAIIAIDAGNGATTMPLALQVAIGIGAGELASYAMHRASHLDGWLWRVHLLHHRPERLNVANALTAHPMNVAYEKVARVAPMLLLGLSDDAVLWVSLFTLTQSLAVHANVAGTLGPLNLVIGSAELHRLHHSTDERQAMNFGTAVPWWDVVFGTFRWKEVPLRVGVFDPSRYPPEHALKSLLLWPLTALATPMSCCGRRGA